MFRKRVLKRLLIVSMLFIGTGNIFAKSPQVAYDLDMAKDICNELPLENVEGIWLYPDDKVTVLILKEEDTASKNSFDAYTISVVDTSDARLHTGDIIGRLYSTSDNKVFRIELSTERKNDLLLKPKSCLATLTKDGDEFVIKKQKAPFKGRLNLNLSRLLPGFWKVVSMGISQQNNNTVQVPVGMIKIYPSYDGNGSSRRKVRYL